MNRLKESAKKRERLKDYKREKECDVDTNRKVNKQKN